MKHCKRCGGVLMGNEQLSETCNRCLDLGYESMSEEEYERLDIYAMAHDTNMFTMRVDADYYVLVDPDGEDCAWRPRSSEQWLDDESRAIISDLMRHENYGLTLSA